MKAWPVWLSSSLLVLAVARCGGSPPPRAPEPEPEPSARPPAEVAHGAAGAANDEPAAAEAPEPKRPDPELVKKALDRTGAGTGDEAAHGLRFEVVEHGPRASWGMALVNRGSDTLRVVHDPSLLTIEVVPPPDPKAKYPKKPKPRVCQLPAGLRAERASTELSIVLAPGQGVVEAFDPRLYCLPEGGVSPFVAGAEVRARFGFPPKTKVVWKGGRHEEPLPEQLPPFVAVVVPPPPPDADAGAPEPSSDIQMEVHDAGAAEPSAHAHEGSAAEEPSAAGGVKQLVATPLVLGGDYAPPPPAVPPPTLALELVQGSDASTFSTATATLKLSNHDKVLRRIYFRRELVSFQVTGPDGTVTCDPQPDERAPDRLAYTALNAGGSVTVTSRLAELCPGESFQRPGLYVIEAQLDAFANGKEHGFDAFVGKLVSSRTVVVRIRSGTLPFPGPRLVESVRVGAP
jgi:hypothetical protein